MARRTIQALLACATGGMVALGCGSNTTLLDASTGAGGSAHPPTDTGPGSIGAVGGGSGTGGDGSGTGGLGGEAQGGGGSGGGTEMPSVAWAKAFDDTLNNFAFGATAIGTDIAVVGTFRNQIDFGGGPLIGVGGHEGFLVRFDSSGTHKWSRAILAPGHGAAPSDVVPDGHGGVFVAGVYTGSLHAGGSPLPATPSFSHHSVFLARYDASGQHVWSQSLLSASIPSSGGAVDLVPLPSGVAVVASVGGTWDVGLGVIATEAPRDLVVVRFDLQGQAQWQRHFPAGNVSSSAARGPAPSIVVGGTFTDKLAVDGKLLVASPNRAFLLSIDPVAGATQWERTFDGTVWGLAQSSPGDVTAVGSFTGSTDLGGGLLAAAGGRKGFVARFDGTGQHISSRMVGSETEYYSAVVDGGGRTILCGVTPDYLRITAYDALGQPESDSQFATGHPLDFYAECAEHPYGVILFGGYAGTFAIGAPTLPPSPNDIDIFIGRYDIP